MKRLQVLRSFSVREWNSTHEIAQTNKLNFNIDHEKGREQKEKEKSNISTRLPKNSENIDCLKIEDPNDQNPGFSNYVEQKFRSKKDFQIMPL